MTTSAGLRAGQQIRKDNGVEAAVRLVQHTFSQKLDSQAYLCGYS